MTNITGLPSGLSSITGGQSASESAQLNKDIGKFQALLDSMGIDNKTDMQDSSKETVSSSQVIQSGRLNGDYTSGFSNTFSSVQDKNALPSGEAANSAKLGSSKTIDKTSDLYEKSLELESYLVKIMLNSMRSSLSTSGLNGEKSYATGMYEDMMYDELAVSMTKNAGFGLADQIYLQLA